MKYLIKPFRFLIGLIWILIKCICSIIMFISLYIWHISISTAYNKTNVYWWSSFYVSYHLFYNNRYPTFIYFINNQYIEQRYELTPSYKNGMNIN